MPCNDGVNWSIEQQLTSDTTFSNTPSIAVSEDYVYVAWEDVRDGDFEIYSKNSTDNGQTWSTDLRLTNDSGDSHYPSAAASGSNIHVTWQDNRDGNDEIYYKISNDCGVSWDPDIRLTDDQSISQNATVAVSGEKLHGTIIGFDNFCIQLKGSTEHLVYKHAIAFITPMEHEE